MRPRVRRKNEVAGRCERQMRRKNVVGKEKTVNLYNGGKEEGEMDQAERLPEAPNTCRMHQQPVLKVNRGGR